MDAAAADLEERLLAAYIGANWERYYRGRFARFRAHPWRPITWNWAAALVPFWPVARNLTAAVVIYVPAGMALVWLGMPDACGAPGWDARAALLAVGAAGGIIEGPLGTWALYRQARSAVARARRRARSDAAALALVRSYGNSSGAHPTARSIATSVAASLLLLLVALALGGLGRWLGSTMWGAYRATVMGDLRDLVTAQEAFGATNGRFAASLDELGSGFSLSTGVTLRVHEFDAAGFSAIGTHDQLTDQCALSCAIFVGSARPPWPGMAPEQPQCLRGPPPSSP